MSPFAQLCLVLAVGHVVGCLAAVFLSNFLGWKENPFSWWKDALKVILVGAFELGPALVFLGYTGQIRVMLFYAVGVAILTPLSYFEDGAPSWLLIIFGKAAGLGLAYTLIF